MRFSLAARAMLVALIVGLPFQMHDPAAAQTATPSAAGQTVYVDPAGRFRLPLPTGWAGETDGDVGVITSPEGGITVYAVVLPGTDIPTALGAAWRAVMPEFGLAAGEPKQAPAIAGLRPFTLVEYQGAPDGMTVQAVGFAEGESIYALLVWAEREEAVRRQSQMQTAALGIEIAGVREVSLRGVTPVTMTPDMLAEVDAFVAATMERHDIPGAAYAVVQDGKIAHAAGFGVTELGGDEPFTPETMLPIASVTKPMTTMYMAALADAGLMRWDTPAVDILPSFAVADAAITPRLTMRDLVCACTGVPKRDLELAFEAEKLTAADVIVSLREFDFYTPVGEAYQYSNQMAAAGGYIAAIADGGRFETARTDYAQGMKQRIFGPIGMDDTTFSRQEATNGRSYALPHTLTLDGELTSFPLAADVNAGVVAPAGGAWSNVGDLARFAITQLQRGLAADGARVVSEESLTETWKPGVQIAPGVSYGLGWMVADFQGQPLLYHTGGTLGYNAETAFLPEAGLGVAVVLNRSSMLAFAEAVRNGVFAAAFGQAPADDAGVAFAVVQQQKVIAGLAAQMAPLDEAAVAPFLGAWRHPLLGKLVLTLQEGRLLADAGEIASELVAVRDEARGDAFFVTATPPFVGFRVSLREEGGTRALVLYDPGSVEAYAFTQESATTAEE
jgi:CubicO group peptidase (beta-lactamase class C family)